jgi:glyoxylase-like metal-dependent hydrolase (beta-lactamase superfamily II)/rhodanese-related sulfurtransferase
MAVNAERQPLDLEVFVTEGLGDSSYLLASGREAVLVDPQRDAWRFLEVAERRGWRVRHVLETHVHNDYLSGALETRAATGAEIVAPARGGYEFEHRAADEGDWLEVGGLRLTAWATPGHTPEHIAWLVTEAGTSGEDADAARALFSGGSLLAGSVGRTDLLGPVLTNALTADQQRSLLRIADLPGETRVLPTHGSGSFCSAGPVRAERTTTVNAELAGNPTLALVSAPEDAFRVQALDGLGRVPDYYAHMARLNRRGPRVLQRLILPPELDPAAFEAAAGAGATIVDARDRDAYAVGHIRGSLNIELASAFSGYVGWLVEFAAPVVLVLPDEPDALATATTELLRVGYERIPGWLEGGIDAWAASGRAVASYGTTTMAEAQRRQASGEAGVLLDVRQANEWATGVVPGSETIFVADLPKRLDELPDDGPVTVFCRTGHRASMAASILEAAGAEVRLVAEGGAKDWPAALEPVPAGTGAGKAGAPNRTP